MARSEREFAASAQAPGAARAFVLDALDDLLTGSVPLDLRSDLELVVSELVTNAVRAGSPTVLVSVCLERSRVVVRVADRITGWPDPRPSGATDPRGRGLPLVSALSATWGVRLEDTGKIVWAELAVPAR